MKITKNRTMATLTALFLALTITVTLVALPIANAHTPPWKIPTWLYIAARNNPIGVNQDLLLVFWLNQYPFTRSGAYGDRWSYTVEVTKPDGAKETLGPFECDPVASGWTIYTPTQVGTYTFVAKFPGHTLTGLPLYPGRTLDTIQGAAYVNDTLLPSVSDPLEVVVQEEQIQPWSESPLPTAFWTRPINSANREWWQLAGNWLVQLKMSMQLLVSATVQGQKALT